MAVEAPVEARLPGFGDLLVSELEAMGLPVERATDPQDADVLAMEWINREHGRLDPIVGSTGWANRFGYASPEIDALLAAQRTAATDTDLRDIWHRLHAVVREDAPYLGLWCVDAWSAWRGEVRRNPIAPQAYWTDADVWTLDR